MRTTHLISRACVQGRMFSCSAGCDGQGSALPADVCWYIQPQRNPSPPMGIDSLLWYPPSEGGGGSWTLPLASVFCPSASPWNHYTISCQTGSEPARWFIPLLPHHQSQHAKLGPGPRDKRVNEAVLGCYSASYPEVEHSVSALLVGIRVGGEQPPAGSIILAEIGFYFQTKWILPLLVYRQRRDEQSVPWMFRSICHLGDGSQSCECCQLSKRPHQMVMLKGCRLVLKKGKGPFCSLFAGNITVAGSKLNGNDAWKR